LYVAKELIWLMNCEG